MPEDEKAPAAAPVASASNEGVRLFTRKGLVLVAILLIAEAGLVVLAMTMFTKTELPSGPSKFEEGILPTVEIGTVEVVFPRNKSLIFTLVVGLENRQGYEKALQFAQDQLRTDAAKSLIKDKARQIARNIKGEEGAVHFVDTKPAEDLRKQLKDMINEVLNNTKEKQDLFDERIEFVVQVFLPDFRPNDD